MAEPKFDEEGRPTDPWARKLREALERERTFDTGGAENQRAQMEEIAQKMDEGQTFAEAVGRPEDGVPQTRSEAETLQAALKGELGKPPEERDNELIQRYATALQSIMDQSGGIGGSEVQQAVQEAFQGVVTQPEQREVPGQGFNVTVDPSSILGSRAGAMAARHRMEDIKDFIMRPFLDDEEQTQLSEQRRVDRAREELQLEADARASGVDMESLSAPKIVGEFAPDVAASAIGGIGLPRTIAGAAGRVGLEAGIGGVLGGSTVDLEEDPMSAALLDAGFTAGLGLVTEVPGVAMDFLRRELRAARNSDQNARMQEISERTGIDLTLGERTQSPSAIVAETSVPGRPGGPRAQFMAQRKEQLTAAFANLERTLNPTQMTPNAIVSGTAKAYDDYIKGQSALASEQFRNNIAEVLPGVGAKIDNEGRIIGGFKFIRPTELLNELSTQRDLLASQPFQGSRQALLELDREIATITQNGMDLGQVQRMLSDLSAQNKPTGIVIKDTEKGLDILNSGAVQRALTRDLENIVKNDQAPEEFREAVGVLQEARREFAQDRAAIDVFKGTQVDRLLGKLGDPESPDFARRLTAMNTDSFNTLLRISDDADPALGGALRSIVFKDLVDRHSRFGVQGSRVGAPAEEIEIDRVIGDLAKMPLSKLKAFTGTDMPDAAAAQMHNTLVALQAIAEGPTGKNIHAQTLRNRAEQWAINAASRDKGFIARLLAGEISPGLIERMMFTKQGQQALTNLSNPKVIGPQLAQSYSYLAHAMSEDERQKQELQQQRQMARMNEGLQSL